MTSFLAMIAGILLAPPAAMAAVMPPVLCGIFPGCSAPISNVVSTTVIPGVAMLLLNSTAALALIFVLIGGGRYLLSFGRDEEHTKGYKTVMWAFIGLMVALLSHRIVVTLTTEQYIPPSGDPLFGFFSSIVRIMTSMLNIAFFIVIVYGGFQMIQARGRDEEVTKGKKSVSYAIIGLIIINLAPVMVKSAIRLL